MLIRKSPTRYAIDKVNWPDLFPYAPSVTFDIWHDGSSIFIHYEVEEKAVRAFCEKDMDNAWEDSCVEFFFAPSDDGMYYNVECTCNGKIYMKCGPDRNDRRQVSDEALASVKRVCSLGTEAFGLIDKPTRWTVDLEIPSSAFCFHEIKDLCALKAKGNFYKCGNLLPEKHFLSHAPIGTATPDFHRPEYFEEIVFG